MISLIDCKINYAASDKLKMPHSNLNNRDGNTKGLITTHL
jgi:hypothetical protein